MNKLVVAYIGMGRAITQYHFPYVLEANNIEVKYVYRRKEDREIDSEIEKEYPQLTIVEDFDVILNDPAVHLVLERLTLLMSNMQKKYWMRGKMR